MSEREGPYVTDAFLAAMIGAIAQTEDQRWIAMTRDTLSPSMREAWDRAVRAVMGQSATDLDAALARAEAAEARVRELEERAALPKSTQRNLARFDSMAALIERQAQCIAALIAAGAGLREYADHLPDCPYRYLAVVTDDDCECGYLATDAAWERAKEGQP